VPEAVTNVPAALMVERLNVSYGAVRAVQDVSLRVPAGEVVALVGSNGAGKSSALKAIAGVVRSTAASIQAHGVDIAALSPRQRILEHGVVLVPEGGSVFTTLTVQENLELGARVGAARRSSSRTPSGSFDITDVAGLFPILEERANRRAEYLSGGERQMLAMARALLMAPSVLLVDEPSMGLAPIAIRTLFALMHQVFVQAGVAVLLVEQDTRLALDLASVGYLLERGTIVASAPAAELQDDPRVRLAYLGRLATQSRPKLAPPAATS
jgi:branched-chain amino acid transport system ATP-binding protein